MSLQIVEAIFATGERRSIGQPVGGGPRLCIGNQFALTEMQLVLLEMLRRFEVEWVDQPPVDLLPLITLRPRQEIKVRFRRR